MKIHTGERSNSCSVCGKGFVTRSILTEHMMSHTGERPHSCSVCEKGYVTMSNLTQHMRIHMGRCHIVAVVVEKDQ
ncbi:hypothetical protein DPMN_145462 [Dreissena polymorpha]|uniref:C2H2-type domain-containing protein n=1 Tax=Dreissena polymorpha TaxID=45954 RepID=A0A9D4J180_DREPO|nr:hypothetical protein DPMN_145462 [Dreissena polymorpha]